MIGVNVTSKIDFRADDSISESVIDWYVVNMISCDVSCFIVIRFPGVEASFW